MKIHCNDVHEDPTAMMFSLIDLIFQLPHLDTQNQWSKNEWKHSKH